MTRVLILINNDAGLYKFRKELLEELLKDYEVYISLPKGPFINDLVKLGCIFIETEINRRGTNPITDIKLIMQYRKILKDVKPDIIYSYTIKPNIYGGLLARAMKIPFVGTVTGLGSSIKSNHLLKNVVINLYKMSFKKSQRIFFQNIENLNFFQSNNIINDNQIKIVPGSGVNLKDYQYQEYPKDLNYSNFIFIGRLMKEKGILELFETAKYFKEKSIKINFHILGFLEEDLEKVLNELEKKDIVIYHGQQFDVSSFISESHAIIHPSYHEGLSNVLLEAAASGRPILASDIPGCRETFDEGITGFGFEPKSTDSLIKTIKKFIELPYEQKELMGILGREKIEREFNREKVVDAYIKEIEKLKWRIKLEEIYNEFIR